jgi:hypothetical protein
MVVLVEKLGGRHVDRSTGMLGIMLGALYLRSIRVRRTLLGQRERFPRTGTGHEKRTCGVCGPVQEAYVSCVSGFACRVYIDWNRRDSQI